MIVEISASLICLDKISIVKFEQREINRKYITLTMIRFNLLNATTDHKVSKFPKYNKNKPINNLKLFKDNESFN